MDELGGLEDAIALAAKEANLTEYKVKEFPKLKDPIQQLISSMSGGMSIESQMKEMVKNTEFETYAQYMALFRQYGSKHSVQAMMPYSISVQNYSLR